LGAGVLAGKLLPAEAAAQDATGPAAPADPTHVPGLPTSAQGTRSGFVDLERAPTGQITGPSMTPLHRLTGTITPADLHFERHHAGAAVIDPAQWKLLIHGMVDRPLVLDLESLRRFPAVTRVHFIECAGNGRHAFRQPRPGMTAQEVDGMSSNTEWTGVPLGTVLREVGIKPKATWALAEGGDAAVLSRSIPMAKLLDDALFVWGQNGEPLRVANGYPVRLLLPGWEGNTSIKWIRRLELIDQPNMSRDETARYTDPIPGNKARQFSFEMDVKSVITSPSPGIPVAGRGWWPISGLAWSGRGRVRGVEVSTDGGTTWHRAELLGQVLPKAHVRFQHMWQWDGKPALLLSRATDETGAVQPSRAEYARVRGAGTDYHFSHIRAWRVAADGTVTFEGEA
jgi:sulfane dehydrogenase subunit SoxC